MAQIRHNRLVLLHCLANCRSFGMNSYRASFSHGGFILPVALLFVRGPFASIKVVGGEEEEGGRRGMIFAVNPVQQGKRDLQQPWMVGGISDGLGKPGLFPRMAPEDKSDLACK